MKRGLVEKVVGVWDKGKNVESIEGNDGLYSKRNHA